MPPLRRSTCFTNSSPVPTSQRSTSEATSSGRAKSPPSEPAGSSDEEADSIPDLEEVDAEVDAGELCEVHMYQVRYDSRGERIVLQVGSSSELPWEKDPSREAALVLTKFYSLSKELESTRLSVNSPYIKQALRDVVGSYPGTNFNTKGPIYIFNEPRCIFHYYAELEAYATNAQDENVERHVRFCLRYVNKLLRTEISAFKIMIENNTVSPGLEYRHLWMAFKPGALLYLRINGNNAARRLLNFRRQKEKDRPDVWIAEVHVILCYGDIFGSIFEGYKISHYNGCKALDELEIFPLEFHVDQEKIREEIVARSRLRVSLCGVHHKLCEREVEWAPSSKPRPKTKPEKVIVDCKEYYSSYKAQFIPSFPTFNTKTNDHLNLTEEQLLICGFTLPAFFLTSKKWAMVAVTKLRDIEFSTTAFDRLVIAQEQKDLISSLIQRPGGEPSAFDDLIEGKGRGLIFLLHGPPGVGKTFTAESISEYTQRPLYNIGCSELSGPSNDVEKSLRTDLRLAAKWNAIVLLDEADVFMEERSVNDLDRNALVSVLLRALEYFEGIMFLTTNRVRSLDPAFKSRIHLSIAYPPFSMESRMQLWQAFISHGSPNGEQYKWLDKKFLRKISREEVNGRQIKNVVSMAYIRASNGKRAIVANDILLGLNALTAFEVDFNQMPSSLHQKEKRGITEDPPSKKRKAE